MFDTRRREFITLLGVAAAAWPLAARAQDRVRRIGVLQIQASGDPVRQMYLQEFRQELERLGWTEGRNVQTDVRFGAGDATVTRRHVEELVALAPDVILTSGAAGVAPLLQATRSIPVVFTLVADPVGAGFVDSLARPGGNATGFSALEYGFGGKWLELLKEIVPSVKRVAVARDAAISAGIGTFGAINSVAPGLGVELTPFNIRDAGEIERALATFASGSNGGLIVTPSGLSFVHRDLIIALAARYKLPAVYFTRVYPDAGGLASYGTHNASQYQRAAGYVDRILKGEKPADLPVQAPTKYELVINLKTAKALGLDVPPTLLARADEVIE
jgi:putative ABC transport system substrate-binding protein